MANRTRLLLTTTDRADVIKDFLETELRVLVKSRYLNSDYEFIVDGDRWLRVSKEYLTDNNPSLADVIDDVRKALKSYQPADRTKRVFLGTQGLRDDS